MTFRRGTATWLMTAGLVIFPVLMRVTSYLTRGPSAERVKASPALINTGWWREKPAPLKVSVLVV